MDRFTCRATPVIGAEDPSIERLDSFLDRVDRLGLAPADLEAVIVEAFSAKGERVVVIDDLIATGGTIVAAANLVEKLGGDIIECAFVVELPDLKGREKLGDRKVFSIIEFEGE